MLKKITVIGILLCSIFIVKDAFNNNELSPTGYTGAPGEGTCASAGCHTGVVQNFSQIFVISFLPPQNPRPDFYTTNTTYNLFASFPVPGSQPARGGFSITALDENGNRAGTLLFNGSVQNSKTDTIFDAVSGRQYLSHWYGTAAQDTSSRTSWAFRWQAPTVYVGKVTFYISGLGANNDKTTANDITYIDTLQFPAGGVSNILNANFTSSQSSICTGDILTFTNTSTGTITEYRWDFGAGATPPTATTAGPHNVSYSSAGVKNIKLVVGDGVDADSITQTITVNAIPTANAGQDANICSGQSTTLTATGGASYAWSNGSTTATINVTPVATTTYTVTATQNGCSATDQVTITVNPSPVVNLANTTLCSGNSIVLNVGNVGVSYVWNTNATTQTITVTSGGTYSVTVTNSAGCSTSGTSVVTEVTSLSINLPDTTNICAGQSATLNAGNPGANYAWSTNATTQSISVQAQGSYRVTVTDANGCVGIDTAFVNVNANPVVSINDEAICNGQSVTLDADNAGASFAWSNQATTQSITVSPSDNTNYSVTVTNAAGCTATDDAQVSVSGVRANDVVVCSGDVAILTAQGGTDYVWSNGETTATITVLTLDTISLTVTGAVIGNCNNTDEVFIYPVNAATATFTFPDTFCSNIDNVLLDDFVNPTGGTFTGTGVTGNIFNASTVLPGGPFSITYEYSDGNGCDAVVTEQFWVIVAPTVSLAGLNAEYCTNDALVQLQGLPLGGSFSGNGVADNLFIPFFAEADTHFISYTYTAANGCFAEDVDTVIVHQAPQAIFFMPKTVFCENDEAIELSGIPAGGVFSGFGVTDSIFTPSEAGVGGLYALQYTYTDSNGCVAVAANNIRVNDAPDLAFSGIQPTYCINELSVPLNALPSGGNFTGNGVSNNELIPSLAGLGEDTISYIYTNSVNCTSVIATVISIVDTPEVIFSGLDIAYCNNEPSVVLNGIPSGGTYSGTGVTGNVFNPATTGIGGPFSINYTYTDNNGCTNEKTQEVFVNESPDVSLSGLNATYCNYDSTYYSITVLPQGGELTGAGIVGETFNPFLAGIGTHIIRYEFLSANGCYDSEDLVVEVANCNSVEDFSLGNITVYPNPFSNSFTVTTTQGNLNTLQVYLFDALGRNIAAEVLAGKQSIKVTPLENIASGLYYLNLINETANTRISLQKY